MFLCGEAALIAYKNSTLSDYPAVCIHAYDIKKLINAVNSITGTEHAYALDSMLTTDSYPNYEMRFCDLSTTDFNAKDSVHYTHNCIHITIKLIENIPLSTAPFALMRGIFKKYKASINAFRTPTGIIKSDRLFRAMTRVASSPNRKVWFCGRQYDKHFFNKSQQVNVDGAEYYIPGTGDKYLVREFGPGWIDYPCHEYAESADRFMSTKISWDEYKAAIRDVDMGEYRKAYLDELPIAAVYKKKHSKIYYCHNVLERTFDRFYLYQKYESKKELLQKLNSENRLEELREELAEYIRLINKYHRHKLGLCFDKDVLELALRIIEIDYGASYANEVRSLVPEEHLQPIRIKDYRGNYI